MNFDQMDLSLRIKRSEKMIFSSVGPFISMLKEKKLDEPHKQEIDDI